MVEFQQHGAGERRFPARADPLLRQLAREYPRDPENRYLLDCRAAYLSRPDSINMLLRHPPTPRKSPIRSPT
jgi:hypothetical protein